MRMPSIKVRLSPIETRIVSGLVVVGALCLSLVASSLRSSLAGPEDDAIEHDVLVKKITYTPAAASADSEKGKQIYAQLTCANCHSIEGKGGCLGPPLDAVGGVRDEHFLLTRLSSDPGRQKEFDRLYGIPELMAHPKLPEAKALPVVKYLLTLPAPEEGFEVRAHKIASHETPPAKPGFKPQPPSTKSRQGAKIFSDHGCAACHSIAGIGGWFGPSLDGIGERRSAAYIASQVKNPEVNIVRTRGDHMERPSMMPKFNLPQADIDKITAFLLTLPNRPAPAKHK